MKCNICPRECMVDRSSAVGICGESDRVRVALVSKHMWEEPCISGENGSGTVFFTGCPLHCVYCQNGVIANENRGREVTIEELSEIFLKQQESGVHNINLVTPTHFVLQIRVNSIKNVNFFHILSLSAFWLSFFTSLLYRKLTYL